MKFHAVAGILLVAPLGQMHASEQEQVGRTLVRAGVESCAPLLVLDVRERDSARRIVEALAKCNRGPDKSYYYVVRPDGNAAFGPYPSVTEALGSPPDR